jgi:hypothetical protein
MRRSSSGIDLKHQFLRCPSTMDIVQDGIVHGDRADHADCSECWKCAVLALA